MSRLAWRLPSAEEARLNAGFFCPEETPLLVARHHVPTAYVFGSRVRMPPGESSAGGTQCLPLTTRCERHGLFGSCVLPAACRDPRTLAVRCAAVLANAEEQLGARTRAAEELARAAFLRAPAPRVSALAYL